MYTEQMANWATEIRGSSLSSSSSFWQQSQGLREVTSLPGKSSYLWQQCVSVGNEWGIFRQVRIFLLTKKILTNKNTLKKKKITIK